MVVARGLVLVLGSAVTVLAVLAYRRTRSPFVRAAAVGFGAITLGAVVEGVLSHFGGFDLVLVHTAGSSIIGLGFATLLYSLLVRPVSGLGTGGSGAAPGDPARPARR